MSSDPPQASAQAELQALASSIAAARSAHESRDGRVLGAIRGMPFLPAGSTVASPRLRVRIAGHDLLVDVRRSPDAGRHCAVGLSAGAAQASRSRAPETASERSLARIWAEVLGRDSMDIHANFFELGGAFKACQLLTEYR